MLCFDKSTGENNIKTLKKFSFYGSISLRCYVIHFDSFVIVKFEHCADEPKVDNLRERSCL